MSITDRLESNRIWLGFVLLLVSWTSFLLSYWAQVVVVLASVTIMLAGVARMLAEYKAGRTQPSLGVIEKGQLGLVFVTLLIGAWYKIVHQGESDIASIIFPLLALINLPRPRLGATLGETS